ncbi:hypothetical protein LTR05_002653 [Lithohypha guttulata]|uniref:Glycoside hydrolase family 43 protein n=1 Tax=Lithohypha guttulata TaxID=1690604 RepID=A0AAN7Y884_9EURO|nr:hypothetical protein LTR05_002653 [Lithohypha guttulata]
MMYFSSPTTIFVFVSVCLAAAESNTTYPQAKPALAVNFPDPALVSVDGVWLAFATAGNGRNVQVAASASFSEHSWRLLEDVDVLPDPGPWAANDRNIWAPHVYGLEDGRWVMYYAATVKNETSKHCVGAALSTNVLGPYSPVKTPFACPLDDGGAIDPAAFRDPKDGNLYVVYKVDGNSMNPGGGPCGSGGLPQDYRPTPILLQQIEEDGVTRIGEPIEVLDRDEADGVLVEAPSLFYSESQELYFMTFSSNCYSTEHYDISFAFSEHLTMPFTKSSYPLITTQTGPVTAPGGADMTPDGKFALFHGTVGQYESGEPIRHMFAAEAMQMGTDMSAWPIR